MRTSAEAKAERAEDVVAVVLEARERRYGVPGKSMEETTEIGYLLASGELTRRQFNALAKYRAVVLAYDEAMNAPALMSGTQVLSKSIPSEGPGTPRPMLTPEEREEAYQNWVQRTTKKHRECIGALIACFDPLSRSTVDIVALSDLPCPQLIGALRIGANALAHVFRLEEDDIEEAPLAKALGLLYEKST